MAIEAWIGKMFAVIKVETVAIMLPSAESARSASSTTESFKASSEIGDDCDDVWRRKSLAMAVIVEFFVKI